MERVVVNRSFTIYKTFYSDGVATDPTGTPTVVVTRLSTGAAVTTGAVTDEAGVGTWSVTVSATQNTLLDTLTFTWTATVNATAQQYVDRVEVAGGTMFSIADARAVPPLDSTTTYPTADLVANRTAVEQALEQACGVAFVPRYTLETVDGTGATTVMLSKPLLRTVRSASVGGVALGVSDLALLAANAAGGLYWAAGWPSGASNVTVGYEHGFSEPPAEIRRAALMLAKMWLLGRRNPIDDRAVTFSAAEGGTYSLAVPGRNGSSFGHPDIDVAVERYSYGAMVA